MLAEGDMLALSSNQACLQMQQSALFGMPPCSPGRLIQLAAFLF